jgi:hypothetical protein
MRGHMNVKFITMRGHMNIKFTKMHGHVNIKLAGMCSFLYIKGQKIFPIQSYFWITTKTLVAGMVTWGSTNVECLRTKRILSDRPGPGCLCTPVWNCHDCRQVD